MTLWIPQVHSALDDWKSGEQSPKLFHAETYADIYFDHVEFLEGIRDNDIEKFHRLMADLYTLFSYVPPYL